MKSATPIVKHLVLVGGGHSHLAVLRRLGMKPVPGLAVTLITRDVLTPYSGSLPGYLAGQYQREQMHIDLRPLAQFAGVRLIQEEVSRIDLDARQIVLHDRPALDFDVLSLNTGSRPDALQIPGAEKFATGIKPIDRFIDKWQSIRANAAERLADTAASYSLVIVGGGPASVEFALAAQARLNQDLGLSVDTPSRMQITLVSADSDILSAHNSRVRQFIRQELARRGINLRLNQRVSEFRQDAVICIEGKPADADQEAHATESIAADAIVYATGASLAGWIKELGLQLSEDGFIEVNSHLQSTSHDFVFAAGDNATIAGALRPKSGVYAVRQGKTLATNLIHYARNKTLRHYRPQTHALALMSLSNGKALASRAGFFYQGRLAWWLKHRIDSAFLRKYQKLPDMLAEFDLATGLVDASTEQQLRSHALRCAGCGAKVASQVLDEVLQELDQTRPGAARLHKPEDASSIELDDGRLLIQSVDYLKAFSNDPWLFARIATNHCLSDIHAMGIRAHSCLAIVGVPPALRRYSKAQLRELMQACQRVLEDEGCELVGGHSAESDSLQFGLCVNAFASRSQLLHKTGLQEDDALILTKPLGTGTLLAADMRLQAGHEWIQSAFAAMLQSNREAVDILMTHGTTACTDVTGFGLAGHLIEMLDNSVHVELQLAQIPALPGALQCLQQGITSSLHDDNSQALQYMMTGKLSHDDPRLQLLFDPQTAGGLLISLPRANAPDCLDALQQAGFSGAAIIGGVTATQQDSPQLSLI